MTIDIGVVSRLIAEVAAEEITPRFQTLQAHEKREKGPGDLVTVVDEAMERRLHAALQDMAPGSDVVGEEACSADLSLLDRFRQPGRVWVIDPLDGTANFASGAEPFAVIVALVENDTVLGGWIHDPLKNRTIAAEKGGGAWMDGERLHTPPPPSLDDLVGVVSARHMPPQERARMTPLQEALPRRRGLFCAGAEYAGLARGERHYSVFYRLMPWDHAAGALITNEAGGMAAMIGATGPEPYRPSQTVGAFMAASSPELWARLNAYVADAA